MSIDVEKYDPVDYYNNYLKDKFNETCEAFLDNLAAASNIDIYKNKETAAKIEKIKEKLNSAKGIKSKYATLKGFFIFFGIVGIICALFGIYPLVTGGSLGLGIGLIVGGVIVAVLFFVLLGTVIVPKLRLAKENVNKVNEELNALLAEAKRELLPFFNSLNFNDFINISNDTSEIFHLDEELKPEKLRMLESLYGLNNIFTPNQSIEEVISGDIDTNPFVKVKVFNMKMIRKTYTGTRVVTWTETYTKSDGSAGVRTESETLVATVDADFPKYYYTSYFIYANKAAESLFFSRFPSGLDSDADKDDVEKFVKKHEKKLEKMNRKAIKKGGTFQSMANSTFETLFGALNRDNETQYRLLFTPLAQQNMVEVITKSPYKDDFYFEKRKMINIIQAGHALNYFSYDPSIFYDYYDFDKIKKDYIDYMNKLYCSLYFEMSPILSIPLYQMTEAGVYNIFEDLPNVSLYESEAFANHMNKELFRPANSKTDIILKSNFRKKVSTNDVYEIEASSYAIKRRSTDVLVPCRNGHSYYVTVFWDEYLERNRRSNITVTEGKNIAIGSNGTGSGDLDSYATIKSNFKNFVGFYLDDRYNN